MLYDEQKHNCWADKMFTNSHKVLLPFTKSYSTHAPFWTPLSIVKQKLWPMSSRDDRPESLIFRVTGVHCVRSWLCMVKLEKTETAHALCLWCWTLVSHFFISNSTSVNKSQSSSALSNTSIVTETVVLTQIWMCGNVITQSRVLLSKSIHTPNFL